MIAYLDGFLVKVNDENIIIDVNGIGYEVNIPDYLFFELPDSGKELKLHTYHHIREDDQRLYGFMTQKEKDFFELLISVSGIGPKKGLKLISQANFSKFISAIRNDNIKYLSSLKGVGKKTAKKIILELGDKIEDIEIDIEVEKKRDNKSKEAVDALIGLGFPPPVVRDVISSIVEKNEDSTTEELVTLGLKELGRGK